MAGGCARRAEPVDGFAHATGPARVHGHRPQSNRAANLANRVPPKLVAAGQADIAVSYQPQLHIHVAEGLPLFRFATLVATPLNTLVVLEDSPIRGLADLKGRKIGFSVGGFEDASLQVNFNTILFEDAQRSVRLFGEEVVPRFADKREAAE